MMCYPARCARCGNTTWGGCGQHVDSVMVAIPPAQRCVCGEVPDDDPHDLGCGKRPHSDGVRTR
ncbi:hypothetical protein DVS77_02635 [Mycolicibacterium moriokaense]|nr:hypothetical protein DVS77_02635 [Mycolicibacterium moriokaense]